MPRISTGYWNARNTPARARSSGFMSSKSLLSYVAVPASTVYAGWPASTCASVLLPEPFGPMIACTSPSRIVRSTPFRISLPATATRSPLTSSRGLFLANASLQTDPEQPRGFDGELHRQLLEHFLAEAVDDHRHRVFGREPALAQVEDLILTDLRRGRFVLHDRRAVAHVDVREGVRPALVADEHRVTLRVVPRALGTLHDFYEPAIGVLPAARRNSFRHDRRARVLAEVNHLRAGVSLLLVARYRDRVELTDRVVALENAAGILPRDRRPGFDLGPGDLRVATGTLAALRDEVVDPAFSFVVARIPVLDRRVLDLRVVQRDELDDRGVELILVPHGRRAALEVTDVAALVRDDQRALELTGRRRVDAEVGRELERTAHTLRHVHERAVGEHRRVERREEVVVMRHDGAEVLLDQIGVLTDRLRDRHEDHAVFRELRLECRGDRHAVEHRIHRDAGQALLLLDRDPELLEGLDQFRIDLVERVELGPLLGGGVVTDRLIVDRPVLHVGPVRLAHLEPVAVGLQAPLQHPFRLALFGRDQPDDVLVQTGRHDLGFDVGDEAVLVRLLDVGCYTGHGASKLFADI